MSTTSLVLFIAAGAIAQSDPVRLDTRRRLFLDDDLMASMKNVRREIHPADKHPANPLLRPTETWEGKAAILYGSVIRDGDRFRMWYHSDPGVSYAESPDGIRWTKPPLGIISIGGAKTNIVLSRESAAGKPSLPFFSEMFGVHKDDRDPDPNRRYKMGFLSIQRDYQGPREDPYHGGQRRGLGVAGSPDGFRWRLIENWATEAICDGATHWMFDPSRNTYILYGRTKFVSPEVAKAWAGDEWVKKTFWGRSVARTESPDFLKWDHTDPSSAPVVMTVDTKDPVGAEIYSMLVFPYESVYIGLVQMFCSRPGAIHLDLQLAVSHDSVHFTRVCDSDGKRLAFIPCGGIGEWDRYNNSIATNPPLLVGDELRFYYGGRTCRHSPYEGEDRGESGGAIGLATIRRDRFVSLAASFDGGVIATKPLMPSGKTLHLNAKCDFGRIVVEAVDKDGKTVAESRPIRADSTDIAVEWAKGDLAPSGPVSLRISLFNARLFAIWSQ